MISSLNRCRKEISRFTDAKVLLGNQQLLMQLINKRELDKEKLNKFTTTQLTAILKKIGVEKSELKKLRKCLFQIQYSEQCNV